MNWATVGTLIGLIVAVLGGLNSWMLLAMKARGANADLRSEKSFGEIKLQIAGLKLDLAEVRAAERDWTRNWVATELRLYPRTETIEARFLLLAAKLEQMEERRNLDSPRIGLRTSY
jgi:hypothetical protein